MRKFSSSVISGRQVDEGEELLNRMFCYPGNSLMALSTCRMLYDEAICYSIAPFHACFAMGHVLEYFFFVRLYFLYEF